MSIRFIIVALAAAAVTLAAGSCGRSVKLSGYKGSSASASASSIPNSGAPSYVHSLTRAELIAKADLICWRVNSKRASITISEPQDFERLIPQLATYQLTAAAEMQKLRPPASMANGWNQIVADAQTVARISAQFRTYAAASTSTSKPLTSVMAGALERMQKVAKREGFRDCAKQA
jgi:hypothetical protein